MNSLKTRIARLNRFTAAYEAETDPVRKLRLAIIVSSLAL